MSVTGVCLGVTGVCYGVTGVERALGAQCAALAGGQVDNQPSARGVHVRRRPRQCSGRIWSSLALQDARLFQSGGAASSALPSRRLLPGAEGSGEHRL